MHVSFFHGNGRCRKTGEPVLTKNTDPKKFPPEVFMEAYEKTVGMPYRKQGSIKVTKEMFVEPEPEKEAEEIKLNEAAYRKILDHYVDKNGLLSYDVINSEMIKFLKSSSIVRKMIAEGEKATDIRDYIVANKFRNIAEEDLSDGEIKLIVELLDEASPKGVFKELNSEIRKDLAKKKTK